ncbi:MAG: YbhB/YbcL family Raf kinase inhibitor-like protein [Alphaproteobacteria bacterium]|nr:YbhB/YbcL family Raf kinase inhibitor-like protein [Alphaproteobacteria bacterium]
MQIICPAIKDGYFLDKYGKRGTVVKGAMPTFSFGFKIEDIPFGTISFAFILDDPDSIPVCGFKWLHWLGANLSKEGIEDNESINAITFIQGKNSWGKSLYGGMAPPDKPHTYIFKVFALDCLLNLKNGFSLEDLQREMAGHILDSAFIEGIYKN